MTRPTVYLFRGETVWMLSLRGIPEDEDKAVPRDVEIETALRTVQAQHLDAEVRVLNWQRPKRDV